MFREFRHDAKGAIERLLEEKSGKAVAALHHPEVGDIDLIWGRYDPKTGNGIGLAKLFGKHREVLDNLQEFVLGLKKVDGNDNRIVLANETGRQRAVVRLDFDGQSKRWLLTAYERTQPPATGKTTDAPGSAVTGGGETIASPKGGLTSNIGTEEASVKSPEYEKAAARALGAPG